jgi:hypothetical protein
MVYYFTNINEIHNFQHFCCFFGPSEYQLLLRRRACRACAGAPWPSPGAATCDHLGLASDEGEKMHDGVLKQVFQKSTMVDLDHILHGISMVQSCFL